MGWLQGSPGVGEGMQAQAAPVASQSSRQVPDVMTMVPTLGGSQGKGTLTEGPFGIFYPICVCVYEVPPPLLAKQGAHTQV